MSSDFVTALNGAAWSHDGFFRSTFTLRKQDSAVAIMRMSRWGWGASGEFLDEPWRLRVRLRLRWPLHYRLTLYWGSGCEQTVSEYWLRNSRHEPSVTRLQGQQYVWRSDPVTWAESLVDGQGRLLLSHDAFGHMNVSDQALDEPDLKSLALLYYWLSLFRSQGATGAA